jgi:hypothetical protein
MQTQIHTARDVDRRPLGQRFWGGGGGCEPGCPRLVITTSDVSYFPFHIQIRGQCGQHSVQTFNFYCHHLGLEPTIHTMRGPSWSVSQCNRDLSHPYGKPGTVDTTVSLGFRVRMLVHCPDENVWQRGHVHPPSMSVADITDCPAQSRKLRHSVLQC